MSEEPKYREGNEEEISEEVESDSGEVSSEEEGSDLREVVTAFLVLQYDDGHVEAAMELDLKMKRKASFHDVRNMCDSISKDVQTTMTSTMISETISRKLAEAARMTMANRVSLHPGKIPIVGRR
jgi:hypothetical protein